MIGILAERCTGCGACVEICPAGAISPADGKVVVDKALCRGCEACLAACPSGAIVLVTQEGPAPETKRLPALCQEPAVVRVRTLPAPVPVRSRTLPVVGTALAWAGREILPRLADLLLDTLDRRTSCLQAKSVARSHRPLARGGKKRGQQNRYRQQGGRA